VFISLKIYISNTQTSLKISKLQVKKIAAEVVKFEEKKYDEVSLNFIESSQICLLHEHYFQDPSITDCISFPMDDDDQDGYRVLGEIFVCPQTAIDYAIKHHGDPYRETTLYIVHGLLHLLGYDDLDKNKRAKMRIAEKKHMHHLQELDLVLCKPQVKKP
jgi:probable rRNA maturation factor